MAKTEERPSDQKRERESECVLRRRILAELLEQWRREGFPHLGPGR